jgi:hypothetical protein
MNIEEIIEKYKNNPQTIKTIKDYIETSPNKSPNTTDKTDKKQEQVENG